MAAVVVAIALSAVDVASGAALVVGALLGRVVSGKPRAGVPIADTPAGWEAVQRELDRARRHERRFAVVRVDTGRLPGAGAEDGGTDLAGLRRQLRTVDVFWSEGPTWFLLLPEADGHDARRLVQRIGADGAARVAAFPEDGVTAGGLARALLPGNRNGKSQLAGAESLPRVPLSRAEPDQEIGQTA